MDGIIGCKTGITTAAGPCLAAFYENPRLGVRLAMILCHSESQEYRWIEIPKMVDFSLQYLELIRERAQQMRLRR